MKNTDFGITNAACSILLKRTCLLMSSKLSGPSSLEHVGSYFKSLSPNP